MSNKLLITLCALFLVSALNAFEFADKATEAKIEKYLQEAKTSYDVKAPHYGYKPIVFELNSTFDRNYYTIIDGLDGEKKVSLDYKNDMSSYTTKCYATIINKDWLLTHRDCLIISDVEAAGDENKGNYYGFNLNSMKFIRGDYNVNVAIDSDNIEYSIDSASGAVLLGVKSVCLEKTSRESNGTCMRFWDWLVSANNGKYKIPENYSTIFLSNIDPKDDVLSAFKKRSFFSPVLAFEEYPVNVIDIKNNILTVPASVSKVGKPLAGEPLFHQKSPTENILVAININNKPNKLTKSDFRQYKLFGNSFTNMLRSVLGKNESKVIITKDLNITSKI